MSENGKAHAMDAATQFVADVVDLYAKSGGPVPAIYIELPSGEVVPIGHAARVVGPTGAGEA